MVIFGEMGLATFVTGAGMAPIILKQSQMSREICCFGRRRDCMCIHVYCVTDTRNWFVGTVHCKHGSRHMARPSRQRPATGPRPSRGADRRAARPSSSVQSPVRGRRMARPSSSVRSPVRGRRAARPSSIVQSPGAVARRDRREKDYAYLLVTSEESHQHLTILTTVSNRSSLDHSDVTLPSHQNTRASSKKREHSQFTSLSLSQASVHILSNRFA